MFFNSLVICIYNSKKEKKKKKKKLKEKFFVDDKWLLMKYAEGGKC